MSSFDEESSFDEDLKEGLKKVNGEADYDAAQEESLFQMIGRSFHGRHRWMTCVAWVYLFLFTGLAVFAAVRFFAAEATRDQVLYATLFAVAAAITMVIKIWYWMILNRNSIQREIKRLELRITQLTDKLP